MTAYEQIASGHILVYYLFDIADEINLEQVRTIWAGRATDSRLVSRRASTHYMQFDHAPILLPLGQQKLQLDDGSWLDSQVRAKVFDFGVVSFCWTIPMPSSWQLLNQHAKLYIDSEEIAQQTRKLLKDLQVDLAGALKKANQDILMEDYTIFYVQNFGTHVSSEQLIELAGQDIATILRGETKALSGAERENALDQKISYFADDLVITTWNSSFIYDPEGSQEHVDVIEFANAELLELRSYDQVLDQQLEEVYDNLEGLPHKHWSALFYNPHQGTVQKLLSLVIEISDLTDRLENSLKLIGDLYSARVYRRISRVLHLQEWHRRVDGKLENAQKIYETLNSEISERRILLLEVVIVILIFVEVLLYFFPPTGH